MLLQTVRPNIVQAIRAYRVEDLMRTAQEAGQHFLYANLSGAQSKQEVLERIADAFLFPSHFGKNLDALYDCMTDLVHKSGTQPGFVIVLEQLPDNPRFDREAREQLLDVFRDAADFWAERRIPFRCFYSFAVARSQESGSWERPEAAHNAESRPAPKSASKSVSNSGFGMNMPPMSSVFDTAMWLTPA
ncbi:MAG: barstar family protein [Burkholderiales bacterium]|nr:MAG: barstar family protein [Burkholderiales bacterium]